MKARRHILQECSRRLAKVGDALLCRRGELAGSSFGWFASSHSWARGCAALLLTVLSCGETGTGLQASQEPQVGHLQVSVLGGPLDLHTLIPAYL